MQPRVFALYQFIAKVPGPGAGADVSVAPADAVRSYFSLAELSTEFGGWIEFWDTRSESSLLGVWGARKASRFRRLLRERGADFQIIKKKPPELRLVMASTTAPPSKKRTRLIQSATKAKPTQ